MAKSVTPLPVSILPPSEPPSPPQLHGLARLCRFLVHRFLKKLRQGRLTIEEGRHRHTFGRPTDLTPASARLVIHQPEFYPSLIRGGSRGLGEAYLRGCWSSPDLTAALCLLHRAYRRWEPLTRWLAPLAIFSRSRRCRRNTLAASRANIAAHYDLGNDFYALFLDETMAYSCAIFPRPDSSLAEAQQHKYDVICRKLALQPHHHLLEIGSGWGGLAIYAARHYGCRVTTTTISRQQFDFAQQAVQTAGLSQRVVVLCQDYRQLRGEYDRLVSIEMIEAVGHEYLPDFFRVCSRCLKADGLMLLQAIIIADRFYDRYLRTQDFIRSHIFPGGCLVSLASLGRAAAQASDLRLVNMEDLTAFYIQTLQHWRQRFLAGRQELLAQGFSEAFRRLWEFYLCYCEAGFIERYTGDVQLLYAKPAHRQLSWPWSAGSCGPSPGLNSYLT